MIEVDFNAALWEFMAELGLRAVIVPQRGPGANWLVEIRDQDDTPMGGGLDSDMLEALSQAIEEYREYDDYAANRKWTAAYKNSLPDSAFLYVRSDCVERRDAEGRSHPLSCRELPVKDHLGNYSVPHVRNAIARAAVLKGVSASEKRALQQKARGILARIR